MASIHGVGVLTQPGEVQTTQKVQQRSKMVLKYANTLEDVRLAY